jgi:hypothetical protein
MNTFTEKKPQEFPIAAAPATGVTTAGPKPSFWDRIGHVPAPVHEAVEEGKYVAIRSREISEKLIRHYPIRAVAAGGFAGAAFGAIAGCILGFVAGRRR